MESTTLNLVGRRPVPSGSVAVIGSPGLRSIGKVALDYLVESLKPTLFAEIYSVHFPAVHHTVPSYAAEPDLPGEGGVKVSKSIVSLPSVEFYFFEGRGARLILTRGYHANFDGQYEVAERTVNFLRELKVRRVVVLAGYGRPGHEICVAVTDPRLLEELKTFELHHGYEGPFYGFSGLVFGFSKLRRLEGICLFGRTEPIPEEPEFPDFNAAHRVLGKLSEMLSLDLDLTELASRFTKPAQTRPKLVS